MENLKKHASLILVILLVGFAALSIKLAWEESATYDERAHISAAYVGVDRGDMRLNMEHPPLLKFLAGLPLLFLDLSFPYDHPDWIKSGIHGQWSLGTVFLYENGNDADDILFLSRLPIILVAVFLGFLIFRWTKELSGTVAALFATLLFVSDPNIIGHSHYVTTDIGIAASIFLSLYMFVRFLRDPSWKNIIFSGIALGIAELTKFSAVLLFPYFGIMLIMYALTKSVPDGPSMFWAKIRLLFGFAWKYAASVAICFALIWAVYIPNTLGTTQEAIDSVADIKLGQSNAYARFANDLVKSMSDSVVLKPLSAYALGVGMVFERVGGGNNTYFLGNISSEASPWYFPIVFILKETLALLSLLSIGIIYTIFRAGKALLGTTGGSWWRLFSHSFQSHVAQYAMAGFALLYSYVSITGNLNIGFRHLFPILPFLYVLVAKTMFDIIRRQGYHGERTGRILIGIMSGWTIATALLAYPSYLSYYNEIAGGPSKGYLYATDSNYDWGQDMKRLRDWIEEYNHGCASLYKAKLSGSCSDISDGHPIEKIRVDYFGGSSAKYYLGDKYVGWYDDLGKEPGWYAISAVFLMESVNQKNVPEEKTYRWLEPNFIGKAGDSIFIYHVPEE